MVALSVKHQFHSTKADGPDTTLLKPSDWNGEHQLTVDGDNVVLGRPAGAGPGPIQALDPSNFFPPGMVVDYAGATAPAGWYLLDGSLKSRTTDAPLFAAIGTQYGAGDGATTFRIPDARGVATAGRSDMGGADRGNLPGGTVLGNQLGATGVGGLPVTVSGTISASVSGTLGGATDGNTGEVAAAVSGTGAAAAWRSQGVSVSGSLGGSANGYMYGSTTAGFNIIQPTIVFNKIIKR